MGSREVSFLKKKGKLRWSVLGCIMLYILLFVPFEKWLNIKGSLLSICTALRIVVLTISLIIGANMSLSGIMILLLMMSTFIIIYSSFYFDATVLLHNYLGGENRIGIINLMILFFKRNIIVMMIGIMIIVVLFGVGKSFKWLQQSEKDELVSKDKGKFYHLLKRIEDKLITMFPIFGYIIIMITVIYAYAGIYATYNNMYQEKCNYFCNRDYLIKTLNSNGNREELFKLETDGKLYEVRAEYGSIGEENLYEAKPEKIIINVINQTGEVEEVLIIRKGFSMNDEALFGTAFSTNYFYFSAITYLTIGYGDIYPIAHEMKYTAVTEGIIAHLLTIIFVPILMTLLQQLYTKRGKLKRKIKYK